MEAEGGVVDEATGLAHGREGGGRARKIYELLSCRRPSGPPVVASEMGVLKTIFFGRVSFRRSLHVHGAGPAICPCPPPSRVLFVAGGKRGVGRRRYALRRSRGVRPDHTHSAISTQNSPNHISLVESSVPIPPDPNAASNES